MNTQIKKLKLDAIAASKILGVSDVEFLDFPDNEMDLISNLQKKLKKLLINSNLLKFLHIHVLM